MSTRAERLGIHRGLIWVVGHSDEENALLDPLPDEVAMITERTGDEAESIAAAVVVVDDADTVYADLDDSLPDTGSIPLVWIAFPHDEPGLDLATIGAAVTDYGWVTRETVDFADSWSAVRIEQN